MKILKYVRRIPLKDFQTISLIPHHQKNLLYRFNINKFSQIPKRDFKQDLNEEHPPNEIPSPQRNNPEISKQQEEYDSDNEDQSSFKASRFKLMFTIGITSLMVFGTYHAIQYLKPEVTDSKKKKVGEVTYVGKPEIGGPWKMMTTDGDWITHKNLDGKYYLIYFGFTQCPDVCPMSLQKIARMLKKLKASQEYKYYDIECFFVSVDPDRDTLERIKQYCSIFDENIKGLTHITNDHPDFKDILKKFKIHSSKIYLSKEDIEQDKLELEKNAPTVVKSMDTLAPKNNLKYSLDHTIVTYLFSPNNTFLTYLSANLNSEEMYNIVQDEIMNDLTKQLKRLPSAKQK
jgi:cytochrome oxidase Cu insertion factor (SCO1/SenC/PrrC family)